MCNDAFEIVHWNEEVHIRQLLLYAINMGNECKHFVDFFHGVFLFILN